MHIIIYIYIYIYIYTHTYMYNLANYLCSGRIGEACAARGRHWGTPREC